MKHIDLKVALALILYLLILPGALVWVYCILAKEEGDVIGQRICDRLEKLLAE
jgi:hypothetical protein